jgi:hypothetical protein
MRAASFLDGKELRVDVVVSVFGVVVRVKGTVEVFDVRREAS